MLEPAPDVAHCLEAIAERLHHANRYECLLERVSDSSQLEIASIVAAHQSLQVSGLVGDGDGSLIVYTSSIDNGTGDSSLRVE